MGLAALTSTTMLLPIHEGKQDSVGQGVHYAKVRTLKQLY